MILERKEQVLGAVNHRLAGDARAILQGESVTTTLSFTRQPSPDRTVKVGRVTVMLSLSGLGKVAQAPATDGDSIGGGGSVGGSVGGSRLGKALSAQHTLTCLFHHGKSLRGSGPRSLKRG